MNINGKTNSQPNLSMGFRPAERDAKFGSPYDKSSWFSKCFYRFVWFLVSKSVHKKLIPDDLDNQMPADTRADETYRGLEQNWNEQMNSEEFKTGARRPSILKAIIKTHGFAILMIYMIDVIAECILEPGYFYFCVSLIESIGAYLAAINFAKIYQPEFQDDFANYNYSIQVRGSNFTGKIGIDPLDENNNDELVNSLRSRFIFDSIGLVITMFSSTILMHPYIWMISRKTLQIRTSLAKMIYKKSLRIEKSSTKIDNCDKYDKTANYKQTISLVSRDLDVLELNIQQLVWIIIGPLECIALSLIIINSVGYMTALVSFLINVMIAFQRGYMNIKVRNHARAASKLADARVSVSSEAFFAIRMLRMCSWTSNMFDKILAARDREIKERRYQLALGCLDTVVFFVGCSGTAIATLIFGYYVMDLEITQGSVSNVFLATNIYRRSISRYLPQGIISYINLSVIFNRITRYLEAKEVTKTVDLSIIASTAQLDSSSVPRFNSLIKKGIVSVENATLDWSDDGSNICLNQVSFTLQPSELLIVVGKVGAGKSSLLEVILGEIKLKEGTIRRQGKMSYAAQEPWIFTGTIRDNILVGSQMNLDKYQGVLSACSLLPDLQNFDLLDMTIIGDRGVTLSGGQKARVNLARCLYQDADIYLLDDPLSAVDAPVAEHIFNEAIMKYLKDKSIILVTHQVQYLPRADRILILDRIEGSESLGYKSIVGDYKQLQHSEALSRIILNKSQPKGKESSEVPKNVSSRSDSKYQLVKDLVASSINCQAENVERFRTELERDEINKSLSMDSNIWKSFKFHLDNSTSISSLLFFMWLNIGIRIFFLGCSTWLSYWAGIRSNSIEADSSWLAPYVLHMDFYDALEVTFVLYIGLAIHAIVRNVQYYLIIMNGARKIHRGLLKSIMAAKMMFFDLTPVGDLINRVSTDLSYMDTVHAPILDDLTLLGPSITIMIAAAIAPQPILAVTIIPLIIGSVALFKGFVKVIDVIKRIDGIRRSNVYTHTSITVDGLATIRANGQEKVFIDRFDEALDRHSSVLFVNLSLRRLLINSVDWILIGFYLTLVLSIVVDTLNGGGAYAFVALNMLISLTRTCQYTFTQFVFVYSSIQSLHRIEEYFHLEPEISLDEQTTNKQLALGQSVNFPEGKIEFLGVSLKYQHTSEIVLKDLTFTIKPKEKIGIVGRTGAGKSSMIAVLFQLYHFEGFVFIDGQDIKQLDVDNARRSISIIPQDPVLFSGTLRLNLDPLDQHSDEELWFALKAVQLNNLVAANDMSLNMTVNETGTNFSVGQRQLICLARAILRRNRLLVLDEATANVDPETDRLIQATIRREFAHCTVLTIAHRLDTIIDSDRIMVLDKGQLVEFDTPNELLNRDGIFSDMVAKSGVRLKLLTPRTIVTKPVDDETIIC